MSYNDIQNKIVELIQHDKALHFMFGFFLFVLSNIFLSDSYCIGIVFIVALIKEIRDEIVYKGFDWRDIIATVLPSICILVLNLLK